MESMQSVLPATMSPGWNDPPNLGVPSPGANSSRLTHLRKRLVDPSISGSPTAGSMMMQPGQRQSHPSSPYTGDTNRQRVVDNASSPNMYETGVSSFGITTSAPAPAMANPQLSIGNHAHGYQQNIGAHYQSPQMISTSDDSRHDLIQGHIPQQDRQGFSTVTPSYPQSTNQTNQSFPNAYNNAANSGAVLNVQADSGNNAQFFHQQQYHEAPPIRR